MQQADDDQDAVEQVTAGLTVEERAREVGVGANNGEASEQRSDDVPRRPSRKQHRHASERRFSASAAANVDQEQNQHEGLEEESDDEDGDPGRRDREAEETAHGHEHEEDERDDHVQEGVDARRCERRLPLQLVLK